MSKRRVHSSIDRLPAALREALTRMLVDDEWPADFPKTKASGFKAGVAELTGKPTYEDLVVYCHHKGHKVSESAIGRFGVRMRILARMKNAGVIVREVMADLDSEKASATQKAVAEMITAQTIQFVSESEDMTSKEIMNVARAMKDCTQVSINADKYIREQLSAKAKAAVKTISALAAKKKIDPETLRAIREQVYGIVDK